MSFLAPLYALGFLALAGPILLHLIRRQPKGEMPFSSLMFLAPSPPPPAQKRKLEQLLLLLLRLGVLAALGLAFMRPFLRTESPTDPAKKGRKIAVLLDTSASMRRGNLWDQAVAQAKASLTEAQPLDQIGLFVFDRTVRPVLSFRESDTLEADKQKTIALDRLSRLKPTWASTELGTALMDVSRQVLEPTEGSEPSAAKLVLISDLAEGSRLQALADWEWPRDLVLDLRKISDGGGNAGLDLLIDRTDSEKGLENTDQRVRVTNDRSSPVETFTVGWSGGTEPPIEAYVPPGESRVVKMPRSKTGKSVLLLKGDGPDFDNQLFVPPVLREEISVLYLGQDEPNDSKGLRFYLERAWSETAQRVVNLVSPKPGELLPPVTPANLALIIVAADLTEKQSQALTKELDQGATVVWVLQENQTAKGLFSLWGANAISIEEAKSKNYSMLRDIAFDHPLFSPMAGPQFGDFTKIQFWKHRRVAPDSLGGVKILARFDDGDPAIVEKSIGKGKLILFTGGWNPADSQLARSSKFVPLMDSLLAIRSGKQIKARMYRIGDSIPLTKKQDSLQSVKKPDGTTVNIKAQAATFDDTDLPGIYSISSPTGNRMFAVNLDPSETLTTPLEVEALEQWGVKVAKAKPVADSEKQMRDLELEQSQSLWRMILVGGIVFLFLETILAGWRTRTVSKEVAVP